MDMLKDRLDKVKANILSACKRKGRKDIPLIVVASKYMSVAHMRKLYELGLRDFGENRVQDFERKIAELSDLDIRWHFFGHVQTNKLSKLLRLPVHLIHSIDRMELIYAIERRAQYLSKPIDCLIEVNFTGEESKYGFKTEQEVIGAYEYICKNSLLVNCKGIMAMAPYTDDEDEIRYCFRRAHRLKEDLDLNELSMGMSNDYIIAVEEGSSILRLGSIFSEG